MHVETEKKNKKNNYNYLVGPFQSVLLVVLKIKFCFTV